LCCSDIDLVTVIPVSRDVICSKTQDHLSNVCVRCFAKSSGNNVNIILGASNAKRLGQFHQNTINASVSGATLDNVEQCISLSTSKIKTPNTHIGKVILCLGTNDVTRNRDDSDQINITATQAISKIKQTFPKSQISVCSILPRKGRGQHLIKMNDTSNHVNGFLKKMCIRDGTLDFIDIHKEFSKQSSAIKPLFDTNDVSGIHISSAGEEKLCEVFSKYLTALPGKSEFPVTPQHDKKRNLSDITISPSSAEAKPKHTKAGSPMMSGILNRSTLIEVQCTISNTHFFQEIVNMI
jgi:lysophospholipase L1-like esterase